MCITGMVSPKNGLAIKTCVCVVLVCICVWTDLEFLSQCCFFLPVKSLSVLVWGIFTHSSLQKASRLLGCLVCPALLRSIHSLSALFSLGDCEGQCKTLWIFLCV